MRRKDREIDKQFGFDIIDESVYAIVSMIDENNEPYAIPLSVLS